MELKFAKVSQNDDISVVSRLIYDTDPYLYRDLFGEYEFGQKLIEFLICNPNSTFFYNYLYCAKLDGVIVGIASVVPYYCDWNDDLIKMAYMENGMEIQPKTIAACEYFKNVFNVLKNGANACNICVNAEYRGKGVASFILSNIIVLFGNYPLELCVIANNYTAVKLYKKFGFRKVREYYDYGGYGLPDILCYSMIRIS